MKKLIAILMVTLGVSSLYADESWLWWMISDEEGGDHAASWDTGWTYAKFKATDGSGNSSYLTIYPGDGSAAGVEVAANVGRGLTDPYAVNITSYMGAGWTYALEVYNSDHGWNGMSEGSMPTDLEGYISIGGTVEPAQIFNFGSMAYSAVPEPNSAMLLLLGLSALALRRKQKKA